MSTVYIDFISNLYYNISIMPLKKGPGTIRSNVKELMGEVQSPARKKAISTIARKNNISREEAKFRQALKIAQVQAKK